MAPLHSLEARSAGNTQDLATQAQAVASQRTILVVDDVPSVCTSVALFLEFNGYKTFRADSGEAALEVLGREQIDGVMMDVQMPRENGFQSAVRLLESARAMNRPLKIWFMTGVNYRGLAEECASAGGLGVFRKPFDWPTLLAELALKLSHSAVDSKSTTEVAGESSQDNGPTAPGATGAALTSKDES